MRNHIVRNRTIAIIVACVVIITCVLVGMIIQRSTVPSVKNAVVGSWITFGSYEQNGDLSNGPEDLEWIVVEKKDGKALLLSRYAIDAKPYDAGDKDGNIVRISGSTWENCTLRKWLNDDFYKTAFSLAKRRAIANTYIENDDSYKFWQNYTYHNELEDTAGGMLHSDPVSSSNPLGAEGGRDTTDKVFLLSLNEVQDRFDGRIFNEAISDTENHNESLSCQATPYAVSIMEKDKMGLPSDDDYIPCSWWLRSPGIIEIYGAVIHSDGTIGHGWTNAVDCYVRPAIWVYY